VESMATHSVVLTQEDHDSGSDFADRHHIPPRLAVAPLSTICAHSSGDPLRLQWRVSLAPKTALDLVMSGMAMGLAVSAERLMAPTDSCSPMAGTNE
jgi:hypothetical protein